MALAKDSIPHALYWDSEMPFHYVRSVNAPGMTYLLAGGEDHKTGQEEGRDGEARFVALAKWAHDHFPDAGPPSIRWSGQLLEPLDGLAYIGATGERDCYVATGFSGNGMTYGAIAGILIADLIEGKANPWSEIYDPKRSAMSDLGEYVKSNVNSAAQYASWITPGDVSSIEEIPYGSGAVIRDGLRKIAVWRDRNGATVQLSAVCPHLECIVTWNSAEETWDCPCHGSRFDAHGKVLCGPAVHDLEPVTEEKEA
jgi:nitrite reductase/ring-hydroxylating ferredoxin subunit